jgi:Kef-type K+ transport system membrane component KefB
MVENQRVLPLRRRRFDATAAICMTEGGAASAQAGAGRFVIGYVVIGVFLAAAVVFSIAAGQDRETAVPIAGVYESGDSECLGESFRVLQSGEFVSLEDGGDLAGELRLRGDRLTGDVTCQDGTEGSLELTVSGEGEEARLSGTAAGAPANATFAEELPEPGASEAPAEKRSAEETFGRLMLAIAAVILAARLVGAAIGRLGQPRVMGEVLAGILLGPTLLGAVAPELKDYLFPADIVPLLAAAANIGLAFYMFLVGLELDPRILRERIAQAAFISNVSVAFPLALGFLVAVPVYELVGPDTDYLPFALFMGVAMSVTAFPVLARILVERRMLRRPVGALAMAGAAIDDVTAWSLLALATAFAGTGSGSTAARVVVLAALFSAGMLLVGRRLLGRVSTAYDEAGHLSAAWIGAIFVGVLLSAYTAQQIGIAPIFGAFVFGLIMPRHAGLTEDVTRRIEDFVVTVLLPLFFVVTGLRTEIGLIDRPELWGLTLLLVAVAIIGKWVGALVAARVGGLNLRESTAIGALMNTRGLTELIVLNIGLELGVISPALFTMLVIMALVTTFMAGPALRLIDPKGALSAPPEEELRRAETVEDLGLALPVPERSIVVAPLDEQNLDTLLALAEPLARSQPPRELIVVRLVVPRRAVTGIALDAQDLERANAELAERRTEVLESGIPTRTVAFTSADPGKDLVRLTTQEPVDLLLVDGRRPLLGGGVPRGAVGTVLEHAPCDVAVLVEREGRLPEVGPESPVVVPFGGAEHDWAALELGAWLSTAFGSPLRLLGASANGEGDASRLLANASLALQQFAGVTVEQVLMQPGREGVLEAAEGAGLLVIGLSERWRQEGLGPVRSEIARSAPAPTLFVRRGTRPGALAPRSDLTRFAWSAVGAGPPAST